MSEIDRLRFRRKREMLDMSKAGATLAEIATEFDLTKERVRQIISPCDGYCDSATKRARRINHVIFFHDKGLTIEEISAATGLARNTVGRFLAEKGLTYNKKYKERTTTQKVSTEQLVAAFKKSGTYTGTAKLAGLSIQSAIRRLKKLGIESTVKVHEAKLYMTSRGPMTIKEMCRVSGLKKEGMRRRLRRGVASEKLLSPPKR